MKVKLGDIATIQSGPFGTQLHKDEYTDFGIPMLNAKNIGNGVVIMDSIDYVTPDVCKRLEKYVLRKGDIIFGRAGSIERHTYISEKYDGCFQGTNCIRIRPHDLKTSMYISYYLWLPSLKQIIENQAGGSILNYITTDLLKEIVIDIPNENALLNISSILYSLDEKIENNTCINDNLANHSAMVA